MKHNKAPRDPQRLIKSKTPTPGKTEKPPRDSRQRSHTAVPMASEAMSSSKNYLIEKMFNTQAGRPNVTTSKRVSAPPVPDSSEYTLYREAKAYDAKIAALSEPLTPPPITNSLAVPKVKKAQEPAKCGSVKKTKADGISDNISESGTYTIEADTHSQAEEKARQSIGKVFGVEAESEDTGDEEEDIGDEVADDGLMEGKLRRLAEEKSKVNPSAGQPRASHPGAGHPGAMTESLEVEVDSSGYQDESEDAGYHVSSHISIG